MSMPLELDHVFIMCDEGAPEAAALTNLGLREGSPNTHAHQGTACRRFFFRDIYLELLWVHDRDEATSSLVRPTGLWDRWSMRRSGACPFGVILRPAAGSDTVEAPFQTWPYRPSYLPEGMAIDVARDTTLAEPAVFHLAFARGRASNAQQLTAHAIAAAELTGMEIGIPGDRPTSGVARALEASGVLSFVSADEYELRLTFDERTSGQSIDLRPTLPLVFNW